MSLPASWIARLLVRELEGFERGANVYVGTEKLERAFIASDEGRRRRA